MNTPFWLVIARGDIGIKEAPGPKNNPTIMGWLKTLPKWVGAYFKGDSVTPWCGLWMASVVQRALPALTLPKNPLSAAAWSTWGVPLREPIKGCILTFNRPGGGHVAFYEAEDDACFHVLGGNQGDAVSVTRISKSRLTSIRWPIGEAVQGDRVWLSPKGAISNNES